MREAALKKENRRLKRKNQHLTLQLSAPQNQELFLQVQLLKSQFLYVGRIFYYWVRTEQEPPSKRIQIRNEAVEDLLHKKVIGYKDDDFSVLKDNINQRCKNILTQLELDFPCIRPADLKLFCYLAVGFDYLLIVELLGIPGIDALYTRKSRLKDKLEILNSPYKVIYLALID